jgi:methionine synthase II (cobalamin-independent)
MAPFRAEHLGSLLRPKELLQARAALEKGEINQLKVTEIEMNQSIRLSKFRLTLDSVPYLMENTDVLSSGGHSSKSLKA